MVYDLCVPLTFCLRGLKSNGTKCTLASSMIPIGVVAEFGKNSTLSLWQIYPVTNFNDPPGCATIATDKWSNSESHSEFRIVQRLVA